MPFAAGFEQKDGTKDEGNEPPETKCPHIRFAEGADGGVNGEAAREQADGSEDGEIEDLPRSGTGKAFADVIDVGDDEDGEDGGLCGDEASHADVALVGEGPLGFD